ncbi:uncharacterized protein EI90DRAFT_3055838 [Cantharellus anzutake]|uniref:uncharacterized protein n=1 Tax=Cantharellus anzutake TaxID=1750568 RepID=UPI0019074C40|nr:uncharacterized protein EI90DRAFT_3055838 [Cantharellus anzutake]KAF8331905.1 hypothetical protein EI90DRAFT_3055838 [Cantharellus anzutake]
MIFESVFIGSTSTAVKSVSQLPSSWTGGHRTLMLHAKRHVSFATQRTRSQMSCRCMERAPQDIIVSPINGALSLPLSFLLALGRCILFWIVPLSGILRWSIIIAWFRRVGVIPLPPVMCTRQVELTSHDFVNNNARSIRSSRSANRQWSIIKRHARSGRPTNYLSSSS